MERHHQHGLRVVILALGTAIGLLGGAKELAADPDFTSVTDVLGGKRQLLRVDDLAVIVDTHPNPNLQETDVLVLQTDGAKIVKTLPPASVGGADGPYSPTSRIAMGQVFNLANDVVATAVGSGNASSQVLYVFLRDTVWETTTSGFSTTRLSRSQSSKPSSWPTSIKTATLAVCSPPMVRPSMQVVPIR